MISLKPIRENAGSPAYTRGNQIYKKDRIRNFHCQNQGSLIETEALVEGSYDRIYHVELVYDRVEDDFLEYSCECDKPMRREEPARLEVRQKTSGDGSAGVKMDPLSVHEGEIPFFSGRDNWQD